VGLVFWNPFKAYSTDGAELSAAVPAGQEVIAASADNEEVQDDPEPVVEIQDEDELVPLVLSGEVTVSVLDVVTQDRDQSNRIKAVKYRINNQDEMRSFTVKVKAYTDEDTDVLKNKVRGTFDNVAVKAGDAFSGQVSLDSGTFLKGKKVNIVVMLYDYNTEEFIIQGKSSFNMS